MSHDPLDALKQFGMTSQLLEHDLDRIEVEYSLDLGRAHTALIERDEDYYPQMERTVRAEAARMAPHYEVFYSLEKTIRGLIRDTLATAEGDGWVVADCACSREYQEGGGSSSPTGRRYGDNPPLRGTT